MTRPRKQSPGSALRDAIAKSPAAEAAEEQSARELEQRMADNMLDSWLNKFAIAVRNEVEERGLHASAGEKVETRFSLSIPEQSLRGTEGVKLETLKGFKELEAASKELDVEVTVTRGRHGYGRKANAGKPFLHVEVNLENPYKPLTAETKLPVTAKRPHHRPHRHNGYGHGRR